MGLRRGLGLKDGTDCQEGFCGEERGKSFRICKEMQGPFSFAILEKPILKSVSSLRKVSFWNVGYDQSPGGARDF